MRNIVFCAAAAAVLLSSCSGEPKAPVLDFCTLEEGRQIISESDKYTSGFHAFDLVSRLSEKGLPQDEQGYLDLAASSVLEWTPQEKELLQGSFGHIVRIADSCGYSLPWPDSISLVKTTMAEEGGAGGYTRGKNIFLTSPESFSSSEGMLEYLLAHELFHVLTRNCPQFRREMYAQIGYTVLDRDIELPQEVLQMRISNPDVNSYDCYAYYDIDGRRRPVMMLFYSDSEYAGGPFFEYGKVGLLELDGQFNVLRDSLGAPVIHPVESASDFRSLIGENTSYVINPEEVLADNFAFALLDFFPYGCRTPQLTEKIREVMRR